MFKYNHDCPFEAFITNLNSYNAGSLLGEWVKFPVNKETLKHVFNRINVKDINDWFISDYDIYVDDIDANTLGEFPMIEELNSIANRYL